MTHPTAVGVGYQCNHCAKTFPYEMPFQDLVLDGDYEAGDRLDSVGTITQYACHDGWPNNWQPCRSTVEDEMYEQFDPIYQCGNCDMHHPNFPQALQCCKGAEPEVTV